MAQNKAKKKSRKIRLFPIVMLLILVGCLCVAYHFDTISQELKKVSPSRFTYPVKYEELVLKNAEEFDIDPAFVYAIIHTESHFDPEATSEVGARGLMQLMPEAYNWVKYRLDDNESKSFDDMYTPEHNIRYGTYMLKYLYDRYDNYQIAAAAYHGGMGAVDGWIEDGTISKEKFNVSDIPSDVTQNYVNKVTKAYKKYKEILEND
ncbi:MAG: lytic transglycosylase domain-containing protein [Oscillospiraceae bacterium]